jgi:hypothetical protein
VLDVVEALNKVRPLLPPSTLIAHISTDALVGNDLDRYHPEAEAAELQLYQGEPGERSAETNVSCGLS